MTSAFTYMGTKKQIASSVADVIAEAPRGPLLDLFCGISSVGFAVAPRRQIWTNDAQQFAYSFATAAFTSKQKPELDSELLGLVLEKSQFNLRRLKEDFGALFVEEQQILQDPKITKAKDFEQRLVTKSARAKSLRANRRKKPRQFPYCLFTSSYAGGYVGLSQAMELDSFRYAFDCLLRDEVINKECHRWFLLALCRALANVASTTGHFAQYLSINSTTFRRVIAQRKRSLFFEWVEGLNELKPAGSEKWRKRNKTFCSNAGTLLKKLLNAQHGPSVIYADPPYTNDQYSRYYHLWETLLLYDYPEPTGKGLYRPGRFVSNFCLHSKVDSEFDSLISGAAKLGSALVINYPKIGVLPDPKKNLLAAMKKHFSHAEIADEIAHSHSTLGASKGSDKASVTELIFYAQ